MAIGSEGEIGKRFGVLKNMTPEDVELWFQYMRENWQPYLHAGWAVLVHKKENNPFYTQRTKTEEKSSE